MMVSLRNQLSLNLVTGVGSHSDKTGIITQETAKRLLLFHVPHAQGLVKSLQEDIARKL